MGVTRRRGLGIMEDEGAEKGNDSSCSKSLEGMEFEESSEEDEFSGSEEEEEQAEVSEEAEDGSDLAHQVKGLSVHFILFTLINNAIKKTKRNASPSNQPLLPCR